MEKLVDPNALFPRQLASHFWLLGNYHFNLFLIIGKKASALIELGISAITDTVIEQLNHLGISPQYLVMTHPHSDHVTGLMGLQERFPGAVLITGQGADDFINHPKAQQAIINEDRFMSEALRLRGILPKRSPIKKMVLPDQRITIKEETNIDLGDTVMRCIPVAGHAPGSLVVQLPQQKAVIAADALGFHFNGRCFLPLYFTSYPLFLASLHKIISLKPSLLGIGHQSPFVGETAQKALSAALKQTELLHQEITRDKRSDETLATELFKLHYRDEFTLYSPENIRGCCQLLVKRSRQAGDS